ncbi:MAG: hypothetical protein SPL73_05205 [Cyanobacteriota bacterium]|nr:hypothetical protein [Cyanobacteriota bacterium]MDY6358982.1 hypothetical protein [Cyanobacteriota bacterium]MDY6364268.1 hypothetical protein [Cyanobacteriota bacterium]MDY6382729.1 hypothetical protein [Cyanobacteriota bacterium]
MRNDYEMVTVKEYVEELSESEKYVLTSVENYLNELTKDEQAA